MTTSKPITERQYGTPLILVTALFFLWALGVNLNDVLIPHVKKVFDLNDFQSALIQVAFFGGYCLSALPAGRLLERIGYKNGIVIGLVTCATGALLFIPAASIQVYGLFLFASFVMACGQGVLEVAANPYVTLLGPAESSERRLNLAQSFNSVGAQVGVASFVIRLAQHSIPGMLQKDASFYLKLHLIGFMIGRFSGSYIMKGVPAARLLSLFSLSTLVCLLVVLLGSGVAPLWALVLIGFFHSIMFPTIFALSIKQLGRYTKLGSSLLVASIIGGAIFPAIMGFISDHSNIRVAFIVPLICQAYVLYFAMRGYRPVPGAGPRVPELSTAK